MDALLFLLREEGIAAGEIARVTLRAGRNVLGPIRYRIATTELEGKFSFAFLLSAIILRGRCGKAEFTDAFVASPECQAMQQRIETAFDQQIEDRGWERIRSKVVVETRDGRSFERWADENYRGSPHNPLSDAEVEGKFRDCAAGLLDEARIDAVLRSIWSCDSLDDVGVLLSQLSWQQ